MDATIIAKTAVASLAILGAYLLAWQGQVEGSEALSFARDMCLAWLGAVTISTTASKWAGRVKPLAIDPGPITPRN